MKKSLTLLMIVCLIVGCNNHRNKNTESKKDNVMTKTKNQSSRKAVVLTADKFEDMEVYFSGFRGQQNWENRHGE